MLRMFLNISTFAEAFSSSEERCNKNRDSVKELDGAISAVFLTA